MGKHKKFTRQKTQWYGWRPDIPDNRDLYMAAPSAVKMVTLQSSASLLDQCPPAFTQGALGSCTSNAACTNHMMMQKRQTGKVKMSPSRLFLYYNSRRLEGTEGYDSGSQIRSAVKALAKWGVCHESRWPYDIVKFDKSPGLFSYWQASRHQAIKYQRLNQNLDHLRSCIADGFPFLFGFSAYQSFEDASVTETGWMFMPRPGEPMIGGHAVLAIAYDDALVVDGQRGAIRCRNSWGPAWGQSGDFWMPYDYALNPDLAADFWTIREVEE